MYANSRQIDSPQTGPHEDVERRVRRAMAHPLRKPVAEHTREAFLQAQQWLSAQGRPLWLDSGCGVGRSTRQLALAHPDHAVIGVDRSEDRLSRKHGELPDNALLVRADLVDFWRLALAAGWAPAHHTLLYPNPYPKARHLKMRWQGHPVFPIIMALGGQLELRTNWEIYAREFAQAIGHATGIEVTAHAFEPQGEYLTHFERKYHESGQALWRLECQLEHTPERYSLQV
ncbi:SAM-dependent methyltransferase [bacterium Scap17]|nr:SAM-dependent methyltransferase [bacterium Scap17]